jgi:hypothetical protein
MFIDILNSPYNLEISKQCLNSKCVGAYIHPHPLFEPLLVFTTSSRGLIIFLVHTHKYEKLHTKKVTLFKCHHVHQSLSPTNQNQSFFVLTFLDITISFFYVQIATVATYSLQGQYPSYIRQKPRSPAESLRNSM